MKLQYLLIFSLIFLLSNCSQKAVLIENGYHPPSSIKANDVSRYIMYYNTRHDTCVEQIVFFNKMGLADSIITTRIDLEFNNLFEATAFDYSNQGVEQWTKYLLFPAVEKTEPIGGVFNILSLMSSDTTISLLSVDTSFHVQLRAKRRYNSKKNLVTERWFDGDETKRITIFKLNERGIPTEGEVFDEDSTLKSVLKFENNAKNQMTKYSSRDVKSNRQGMYLYTYTDLSDQCASSGFYRNDTLIEKIESVYNENGRYIGSKTTRLKTDEVRKDSLILYKNGLLKHQLFNYSAEKQEYQDSFIFVYF